MEVSPVYTDPVISPASQSNYPLDQELKKQNSLLKTLLFVVVAVLLVVSGFFGFVLFHGYAEVSETVYGGTQIGTKPYTTMQTASSLPEAKSYDVVIKEVPLDTTKSDIYLKDRLTGNETLFITLTDIYRQHYHNAEYHNGNLYIIARTGGDFGYQDNPNWTDILWRYNPQKQAQKLYSVRGLDFRVSDDEKNIAIITNESLILLDNKGNTIHTFGENELKAIHQGSPMFRFLEWAPGVIWLDNTLGPSLAGLAKIDLSSYNVTTYDLSKLSAGPEFTLNAEKGLVAFSNYPALFEVDGANEYHQSSQEVTLMVYDLNIKMQQPVATSIAERFNPKWINENTLEYDNPHGEGKLSKSF